MAEDIHDRVVRGTYWWGVPTLLGAAHDPDPAACDVALVGVPHSTGNGTTERDQHLGPRAVRHVSGLLGGRVHGPFGIDPWQVLRVHDLGDVLLPEGNDNERCIARISKHFRTVDAAGARPVAIGGDHSITGAILRAVAGEGAALTGGRPAGLLHIDAHTDTFDQLDHFMGARDSAAHWASYLVREGRVDPARSVQIGLRGHTRSLDWLAPSRTLGYEVVTMARFREIGLEAACRLVRQRLGDGPIYITFDLDSLDPTVAPAVSNLEAGESGFSVDEAMALLRAVRGLDVIGGDVVCLMPTKDSPNNITAMVASYLMFEMLALIAARAAGGAAAPTPGSASAFGSASGSG
ncbi:MAG: arginase family protein [Pseudomonadota bacterium]